MPSLRKRVSSYFRQLSFHNEPREKRNNINENSFVNKYLQGQITLKEGPPILYGKNPTDLPSYDLGSYDTGSDSIIGCYTGPNGGLATVKRTEKHLSVLDADIDFIDTLEELPTIEAPVAKKSPKKTPGAPLDNTTMVIKVAGQEYTVTNRKKKHSKSHSLGSLSDFQIEVEKTKTASNENNNIEANTRYSMESGDINQNRKQAQGIDPEFTPGAKLEGASQIGDRICDNVGETKDSLNENERNGDTDVTRERNGNTAGKEVIKRDKTRTNESRNDQMNRRSVCDKKSEDQSKPFGLSKSKSEGNPFRHKKQGKIIRIERPNVRDESAVDGGNTSEAVKSDALLPSDWNKSSDFVYGMSDSLYDRNQITKVQNGDPIADCFGIIARHDSAILALADGVNWGEKACIAAKSAVHGSLHYLNKTIFNDTGPFESLVRHEGLDSASSASSQKLESSLSENQISNTREVFICLLRAFNCAHDLILENNGMLTTLTVAVILPLRQSNLNRKHFETYAEPSKLNGERRNAHDVEKFVCCVCNVGDTLAYVYSQKYGVRELTKGSHDINCNRDMRDALGALGPVDGINPELSNLTLSITTIQKGDIVLISSDGLSDNFDPNVCKFSVSSPNAEPVKPKRPSVSSQAPRERKDSRARDLRGPHVSQKTASAQKPTRPRSSEIKTDSHISGARKEPVTQQERNKPPIKPPRRSKNRDSLRDSASRSSTERSESVEKTTMEKQTAEPAKMAPIASPSESISTINTPQEASKNIVTNEGNISSNIQQKKDSDIEEDNPLVAQFMRENSLDDTNTFERVKKALISPSTRDSARTKPDKSSLRNPVQTVRISSQKRDIRSAPPAGKSTSMTRGADPPKQNYKLQYSKSMDVKKRDNKANAKAQNSDSPQRYAFLRSKTSVEMRPKPIARNPDGIPYVTPIQRYELTLLLIEDILKKGISGREAQCVTAKKLCENLLSFTFSITSAKRHTLEDNDLYFDNRNGILVEVSAQEKKLRRKQGLERVQNLPGKLDHVSVVAYNVGNFSF